MRAWTILNTCNVVADCHTTISCGRLEVLPTCYSTVLINAVMIGMNIRWNRLRHVVQRAIKSQQTIERSCIASIEELLINLFLEDGNSLYQREGSRAIVYKVMETVDGKISLIILHPALFTSRFYSLFNCRTCGVDIYKMGLKTVVKVKTGYFQSVCIFRGH